MKKTVSAILVCVLLLGTMLTLVSCDRILFGKYEADLVVSKVTYEFSAFNKVTITVDPIIGETSVTEGTYKIAEDNEGNIEFVFTAKDGEPEASSFSTGEEDGVKYIKIGGVKYNKAD